MELQASLRLVLRLKLFPLVKMLLGLDGLPEEMKQEIELVVGLQRPRIELDRAFGHCDCRFLPPFGDA